MKEERKQLLAKIAYLHYIEGKSQTQISKELGIYRTTVCRMLARAKELGLVQIEIIGYDASLFALEEQVRAKYGLERLEIVPRHPDDRPEDLLSRAAKTCAELFRQLVQDGDKVGLAWGSSLSRTIDMIDPKMMKHVEVYPLAGGPSHINISYHVNTLVYRLAKIFQGKSDFINAMVVQENKAIRDGIVDSKYFANVKNSWNHIDVALVGIGGTPQSGIESQWLDLLNKQDVNMLKAEAAVGEMCCRFFNKDGQLVANDLQERIIGITLEQLIQVPKTIALATGTMKAEAILAALKTKAINYLVTDCATIHRILQLDQASEELKSLPC
ncbi:sugar-binding transcriptional regulator [Streptococcus halichoeri]|uniref:sugar-binding transcriptional regulator n=1 Tax=Streptococcus halichoeri TaxID=254785 RepID=UPI00135A5C6A|nr:sugar-binding transcriptional regulator [Streptococcus halichoeri]